MKTARMPAIDRIMQHVDKRDDGCWIWIGKGRTGKFNEYGGTRCNGKQMSTHRAVWILMKGYVPGDLLHQCQHKLCCNPDHLREGTHTENLHEAVVARGGVYWNSLAARPHKRKVDRGQIKKDAMAGMSQRAIATKHNVTPAYVSQIVNGKHLV